MTIYDFDLASFQLSMLYADNLALVVSWLLMAKRVVLGSVVCKHRCLSDN